MEQTQEMCDTPQDALLDTVRQLLGQPTITADQLHLAKLPGDCWGVRTLHWHPGQLIQTHSDAPLSDEREIFCWSASEASAKSTQHRWLVTSWMHPLALAYVT